MTEPLDNLLGYRDLYDDGTLQTRRSAIDFVGATFEDDAVNNLTRVTFGAGSVALATAIASGTMNAIGTTGQVLTSNGSTAGGVWGLLVDANVDPNAGVAGTKISPDFGAQNILTTGFVSVGGATVAAAGAVRLPAGTAGRVAHYYASGAVIAHQENGGYLQIGNAANPAGTDIIAPSGGQVTFYIGASGVASIDANGLSLDGIDISAATEGYVLGISSGVLTWVAAGGASLATTSAAGTVNQLAAANSVLTSDGSTDGGVWVAGLTDAYIASGANLAVAKLAPGTNGYVLTTTGGVPVWAAPASDATKADKPTAGALRIAAINAGNTDLDYPGATLSSTVMALGAANLTLTGYIARGATPATAGSFRASHGFTLQARNNANSADLTLLDWGNASTDYLTIGSSSAITQIKGQSPIVMEASGVIGVRFYNTLTRNYLPLTFANTVSSPGFYQESVATATVTGQTLTINAQDCSGTTSVTAGSMLLRGGDCTGGSGTRNGGNWVARAGVGATANGYAEIQSAAGASGNRLRVNTAGIKGYLTTAVDADLVPTRTVGSRLHYHPKADGDLNTTTTATTELVRVTLPTGCRGSVVLTFRGFVQATESVDYAVGRLAVNVSTISGTAVITGSDGSTPTKEGTASTWVIDPDVDGLDLLINVDGQASGTVEWSASLEAHMRPGAAS